MRKPGSVETLNGLGRKQLSPNFFMREFLHSEVANFHGIPKIPDDPDTAIRAGKKLCRELLEPLHATFGRVVIRSGFRSAELNAFANEKQRNKKDGYNCTRNEDNYAAHIWDHRDANGHIGATACIVLPWFLERYEAGADWRSLAWWIHDHLPYATMMFFPKLCAFNIQWHEQPERTIKSRIPPHQGILTKPGEPDHEGDHSSWYAGFPPLQRPNPG